MHYTFQAVKRPITQSYIPRLDRRTHTAIGKDNLDSTAKHFGELVVTGLWICFQCLSISAAVMLVHSNDRDAGIVDSCLLHSFSMVSLPDPKPAEIKRHSGSHGHALSSGGKCGSPNILNTSASLCGSSHCPLPAAARVICQQQSNSAPGIKAASAALLHSAQHRVRERRSEPNRGCMRRSLLPVACRVTTLMADKPQEANDTPDVSSLPTSPVYRPTCAPPYLCRRCRPD